MAMASEDPVKYLSGFQLSYDRLWELKYLLDKRPKTRISERMSVEAKLVIKQLQEEKESRTTTGSRRRDSSVNHAKPKKTIRIEDKRTKRKPSFAETFDRKSSFRFDGDITGNQNSEPNPKKRVIGGDHAGVAMETIEIVNTEDPPKQDDHDEVAIAETAKLNAVEKCIVWMEVNDEGESNTEIPSR